MNLDLCIVPYKQGSQSASLLKEALNIRKVRYSKYSAYSRYSHIINWGCDISKLNTNNIDEKIIQHPNIVYNCNHKLRFMHYCNQLGLREFLPEFYIINSNQDKEILNKNLLEDESLVYFGRNVLMGHSGVGIEIYTYENLIPLDSSCRLFTKYIPNKREYRFHYFNGEIILIQKKLKRREAEYEEESSLIRTHSNNYVFAQNLSDKQLPLKSSIDIVIKFCKTMGLLFGGVDIIEYKKKPYILEINTAPGLSPSNAIVYAENFRKLL